jgi:hypothetical protein
MIPPGVTLHRFATASRPICWNAAPISGSSKRFWSRDKLDATARYTRVATAMIANVESPLHLLTQPRNKPSRHRKDPPPA